MKETNQTKTKNNPTPQPTQSAPPTSVRATAAGDVSATAGLASRSQLLSAAEFLAEHRRQQESRGRLANADPQTEALVDLILAPGTPAAALAASAPAVQPKAHQVIKLGIDVHLDRYVVVRQIEGGVPRTVTGVVCRRTNKVSNRAWRGWKPNLSRTPKWKRSWYGPGRWLYPRAAVASPALGDRIRRTLCLGLMQSFQSCGFSRLVTQRSRFAPTLG